MDGLYKADLAGIAARMDAIRHREGLNDDEFWSIGQGLASAEVLLSIETSMVGGSAVTWVADSASRPAGPPLPCAVTMVAPMAR